MPVLLEPAEAALLQNAEWFEIKRRTTEKLYAAFELIRQRLKDTAERLQLPLPAEVTAISAKISRGEHYRACPWVMLDHHRYFQGPDMFAFRVMAWYGHYFSAHVLLGGRFAHQYVERLLRHDRPAEVYFSLHPEPWEHAIEAPAYAPLHTLTKEQIMAHLSAHDYIKLSIVIPTVDLGEVEEQVVRFYGEWLWGEWGIR